MSLKPASSRLNLAGTILEFGSATDVGRARKKNEDFMGRFVPKDPAGQARKGALFLVCDGMGGHVSGEVASKLAVETTIREYYKKTDSDEPAQNLEHAVKTANQTIHTEARGSGMGSTLVGLLILGGVAYIVHVGDSRCYRVRDDGIEQMTKDHSWVAMQVVLGEMTPEEAETSDRKNILIRCMGHKPEVKVDVQAQPLQAGDTFLICCDGLHGLVPKDELFRHVHDMPVQTACTKLVELANQNGGTDNISLQIVKVEQLPG